jgi:nitrate reductase gamma subunit
MLVVKVFGLSWFQTDQIHPLYHPQRWLGYFATVLLLYGTGSILLGRITKEKEVYKSSEFADWIFLALLFATTLSGIILHILRLSGFEVGTCYAYAIHVLIATPMLIIEMPFGKWTHMIYRPLAVSLRSLSLKERTLERQWSPKEVPEHATT